MKMTNNIFKIEQKWLVEITLLAGFLFLPLFSIRQIGWWDFWWWISANIIILTVLGYILTADFIQSIIRDFRQDTLKKVSLGLIAALILYFIFFFGNYLSRQLFSFAGAGIHAVYDFKAGKSLWRVVLLLTLIIGPGEEIFWRGFLQQQYSMHLGRISGFFIVTLLYTLIHVGSGNIMLVLAALVCGIAWGLLYWYFQSITINIVSHLVWDLMVFIVLPFN
jgi:membrane protease YdiL (CAAX protease family)